MSAGGPLWLDILRWAFIGLVIWLMLGTLIALAVGKVIAFGEREEPRHVAARAARQRGRLDAAEIGGLFAARRAARGLTCRPGRPCRACSGPVCMPTPCCPHCPWDPTNDQM